MKPRAGFYEAAAYIAIGVVASRPSLLGVALVTLGCVMLARYIAGLMWADFERRLEGDVHPDARSSRHVG